MKRTDQRLLAVLTNGETTWVPNSYEGIRAGVGGTLDFVSTNDIGAYVDDNGMLENRPLNVVVSMMMGAALYGNCVICAPHPDSEGDTLPAKEVTTDAMQSMAMLWRMVVTDAVRKGQDINVYPNADTIPPPHFIAFTSDEDWSKFFGGPDVDER